jgi:hypothetical protein
MKHAIQFYPRKHCFTCKTYLKMIAIATIAKFLKIAYFVNSEFVVKAWHKSVLDYGSRLIKVHKGYYRDAYLVHEQYRDRPNYGEQFFFENLCGQRHWGMLLSRGSYKKCQKRLLYFMESSHTKPILIENSENTLLETENLNF